MSVFFRDVAPERLHVPGDDPNPCSTKGLYCLRKRDHMELKGTGDRDIRKEWVALTLPRSFLLVWFLCQVKNYKTGTLWSQYIARVY